MTAANLVLVALVLAVAQATAQESACGRVYTKKQFILESPGYPNNYPKNFQCAYLLKGPGCPAYFNLQFLDFNLENSEGCNKDRLEIEDVDALCGNRNTIKTYFAPKGTLVLRLISDADVTGRGYRVLVTRLPCNSPNPDSTTLKNHTPAVAAKCCSKLYNTKRFVITSPNFPNSLNTPVDCVYEIHKYKPEVCRLRIHSHFFYLGGFKDCSGGFMKIDNRNVCGCQQDLKLMSQFDESSSKFLQFNTKGLEKSSYGGFVLEIFQDECPKKYVPDDNKQNLTKFEENFRFYNDQINRISWPNDSDKAPVEKLKLVSQSTEIVDDEDTGTNPVPRTEPDIVKSVYYFVDEEPNLIPRLSDRDREETTYLDTSDRDPVVTNVFDYNDCLNWNQLQFNYWSKQNLETCKISQGNMVPNDIPQYVPQNIPQDIPQNIPQGFAPNVPQDYPQNIPQDFPHYIPHGFPQNTPQENPQNIPQGIPRDNCVDLGFRYGFFKTPGYPFFYPGNLNVCYRFRKQPGACTLRVYMKDFHLHETQNCIGDYLLLGNAKRYCGSQLSRAVMTFDMRTKNYQDMIFVTDNFYCGRGFIGTFEQIACPHAPTPPPYYPPTPPTPVTPRPPTPGRPCGGVIQDRTFTLQVFDYDGPICSFLVRKFSPDVCQVRLDFENFDLFCASESLVVDGMMYCGRLIGESVTIDTSYKDPVIVYRKTTNGGLPGLRLRIRGVQIPNSCPEPEVPPAVRLLSKSATNFPTEEYFLLKINQTIKSICGIIKSNESSKNLSVKFCDQVKTNDPNILECRPLKTMSPNVPLPLESQKLQLQIEEADKTKEVNVHVVDCDCDRDIK